MLLNFEKFVNPLNQSFQTLFKLKILFINVDICRNAIYFTSFFEHWRSSSMTCNAWSQF